MISLVFLMVLVAPAACAIVFNGGTAQWNNGSATGNTIEITSRLTYTIEVDDSWGTIVFDEAVTDDWTTTLLDCSGLQVIDCLIENWFR